MADEEEGQFVGRVMLGAGMASQPEEFLEEFEKNLTSTDGDPFATLKKFAPTEYPILRANTSQPSDYLSPEGRDGAKAKSVNQEYQSYSLFELATPPYNMDKLVKVAEKSTPHYAAVAAKVANITELGYDFIESEMVQDMLSEKTGTAKDKAQKRLRKEKRNMKKWVEGLNNEDEIDEILTKVAIDYFYTGNGYIEISRTATGGIGYIGHIPSTTIRIRNARDGYVQLVGDKAVYFKPFGRDVKNRVTNDPSPNEIIHIKNYSPLSGYYGVPEIVVALMAVAGTELASRYNLDYFHNKATPRYVVVTKGAGLSDTSQKQVMEFFETGLKGTNHRSLYVPLPSDTADSKASFEMKPVEAGVQEASFEKYIRMNNNFILMAHRVPSSKVGLAEGVSLAVARDADKTFTEQVVRPMQAKMEKKVNKVFHKYTDMFDFKFTELSLSDEDTKSKIHERYLKTKTLVPNEVRAEMGKPAIDGGDKPIELSARQAADQRANTRQNRQRDSERSAGATDTDGEGRATQGDGRTAE